MFSNLLKYSKKCAKAQTKDLKKSEFYSILIDKEIKKLINKGINFSFKCRDNIYQCPVKYNNEYFRPLFNMSTHRKIKEAKADDSYAVDFDVPLSSEVFASESGIITAIQSESQEGGNSDKFAGRDNYLYIFNKEKNLIFCYRHLEPFNNISQNQEVQKGMLLGRVGLTGYVITPHLHFTVYDIKKNSKFLLKSLPIEFIV